MNEAATQNGAASQPQIGGASAHALAIEELHSMAQFKSLEDLQVEVWGEDLRSVVPAHVFYLVASTGGIVLGAYAEEELAGFAWGILAQQDGRLYHASHQLGIRPSFQGTGLGAALKWRQRELALRHGLDLMTWTFDPLEARNAHFNLHKLGAASHVYRNDVYGEMTDQLNRGLPSDRLVVEWRLNDGARKTPSSRQCVSLLRNIGDVPVLDLDSASLGQPFTVEIPASIQRIKLENLEMAGSWRLAVRRALTFAFGHCYVAQDFVDHAYVLLPLDQPE